MRVRATIERLRLCLSLVKASSPGCHVASWYVLQSTERRGPFHAAEVADLINEGQVGASDVVLHAITGCRGTIEDHPFFSAWLHPSETTDRRLARGLVLCLREYVTRANVPFEVRVPTWAMTDQEQAAFQRLSLPPTCTPRQARRRVRQLSISHHPDRNGSNEVMTRINQDFAVVQKVVGL